MMPKVALIVLVCFFPIAVALLDSFRSSDPDLINLMRAMGAKPAQIFRHVKWPAAISGFFSGLKIAVSYAIVGAVISEWLGGNEGLGDIYDKSQTLLCF
jgi:ABC-type nitrate/sulfonate/bicarbonate transport system permease component